METAHGEDAKLLQAKFERAKPAEGNVLSFRGDDELLYHVLSFVAESKIPVQRIERAESSLESLFLEVTGK